LIAAYTQWSGLRLGDGIPAALPALINYKFILNFHPHEDEI
jgi:hypothetical protein